MYYGDDYYYEVYNDYVNGYYWTYYDDGTYNYECESGTDWGYCYYGGAYGDIWSEWWYEDDGATYVYYSCDGLDCTTCVYDTSDWSYVCDDEETPSESEAAVDPSEECTDYVE